MLYYNVVKSYRRLKVSNFSLRSIVQLIFACNFWILRPILFIQTYMQFAHLSRAPEMTYYVSSGTLKTGWGQITCGDLFRANRFGTIMHKGTFPSQRAETHPCASSRGNALRGKDRRVIGLHPYKLWTATQRHSLNLRISNLLLQPAHSTRFLQFEFNVR